MDNYFKECPANMSDGRIFTDYRTSSRREQFNKTINGIIREDEYRAFLQNNGETILNRIWNNSKQNFGCFPNQCIHKLPTRTSPNNQYLEMQCYNSVRQGKKPLCNVSCTNLNDYRANWTKQQNTINSSEISQEVFN